MTLNPNKYKLAIPTILRMWERLKEKPDIHDIVNDIGLTTQIELSAVVLILEAHAPDPRLADIKKTLLDFYKYDAIVPLTI